MLRIPASSRFGRCHRCRSSISGDDKAIDWQRDPTRLSAFRVEVLVGVSSLEVQFTQTLLFRSDG